MSKINSVKSFLKTERILFLLAMIFSSNFVFANSTEEEMLTRLRVAIASRDFNTAIREVNLILYRNPMQQEARRLGIQAYAGRAGLRPWEFLKTLDSPRDSTYFRLMAEHFTKVDHDTFFDLQAASGLVEGRKLDGFEEDLWQLALAGGSLGASLNFYAYKANGGGLIENFDACDNEMMPETVVQEIIQKFSHLMSVAAIPSIGPDLTPLTSSHLVSDFYGATDVDCSSEDGINLCFMMRSLLNEGDEGIGLGSGLMNICTY